MPLKVWLKLTILFTALTATILAIFLLKQGHMTAFWTSLGFGSSHNRMNWCEERVGTLHVLPTSAKLYEKEGEWRWSQERDRAIDYLKIEKWFAKYCQVDYQELDGAIESPLPLFEAVFLNGERVTLFGDGENVFQIRGQKFKSETMRQALEELLAFGDKIE